MTKINTDKIVYAIFDFDHTITNKDTLFDFLYFISTPLKYWGKILLLSPVLLLTKLHLVPPKLAKELVFYFFLRGLLLSELNKFCEEYAARINEILNPQAIKKILWHQSNGHVVLINSASVVNWIKPWAEKNRIKVVIGTELDTRRGMLTGRIKGENCNGLEKVLRLKRELPDFENKVSFIYGDSKGDKEMLKLATHPFFKTFD